VGRRPLASRTQKVNRRTANGIPCPEDGQAGRIGALSRPTLRLQFRHVSFTPAAAREPSGRKSRYWYLGLWSICALIATATIALEVATIVREGGARKELGWSYGRVNGQWEIQSVDSTGPAAGLLERGDRIVAVDGDARAAKIGPRWYLRDTPDRAGYGLTIARRGVESELSVPWPVTHSGAERAWQWVHLITALAYLGVALLLAITLPDSVFARRAVIVNMLTLGFFFTVVLETDSGIVSHVPLALALGYYFVRPFHLVAGYRFTQTFPLGDRSTRAWRRFDRLFYAAGFVLWVPSVYGAVVRSLGPARAVEIAVAQYPFSLLHDGILNSFFFLFAGVVSVANALVCYRNYKLVPSGDLQRRLRWVSVGIGVGLLPLVLVAPLLFVWGLKDGALRLGVIVHLVNTAVIIIPFCISYAVIKHRVLGIRVIVRAGVRYLFARNVLRLLLAGPLMLIVYSVISHPGSTVGELLLGPAGRLNAILLLCAALALAYRTTLMERIDRRFFREAYRQDQIFVSLAEAIARVADVPELARLLSSQLSAALHPTTVLALTRGSGSELDLVYSSEGGATQATLNSLGLPIDELNDLNGVEETQHIRGLSADGHRVMQTLGIELAVPIRGPNEGLVGVLLLGEKRSEEPYTGNDRRLLEATAAQTGVVWENLQLRQALSREQGVRRHLISRLDAGGGALVMECPLCGACYDGDVARCATDGRELVPSLPTSRDLDGKYRLNKMIGRGGMGAVYAATDLRLERSVAVKAMMGTMFDDAVARQRFAREARASAKILHPNVVGVYDFGEFEGGAYLVLEFLRGKTLRAAIDASGRLSGAAATPLLMNIFDGVAAAHAHQVIHRDLKPENIFLADGPHGGAAAAKILDFGLAVARDIEFAGEDKLTRTGTAVGTLAYMSPEQLGGEAVDERTDIHALGIIVLEVLTGSLVLRGPFFTRADNLFKERLSDEDQRPMAVVLARACHAAKENRYASVEQFRDALLDALSLWPPADLPVRK
jgi:tRNA A-37 threonylcarbamoyl transferase component Bud32